MNSLYCFLLCGIVCITAFNIEQSEFEVDDYISDETELSEYSELSDLLETPAGKYYLDIIIIINLIIF